MSDREDATARALDLLPPGDPAASDPRLRRDPELIATTREVQEAATDVWLAVSPLRAAPPEVLSKVIERLELGGSGGGSSAAQGRARWLPWLAASGWAAAVIASAAWWLHDGSPAVPIAQASPTDARSHRRAPVETMTPQDTPSEPVARRERREGDEIARLRRALAAAQTPDREGFQPRVIGLHAPGKVPRSREEDRERLLGILTDALKTTLEIQNGGAGDPATLVIERGWLPEGMEMPEDGLLLRHKHFPEDSWASLGLRRSEEGSYYDPANGLIWAPDGDGSSFLGRKATAEDNLGIFTQTTPQETAATFVQKEPEGFLIADPQAGVQRLVVSNLPALTEGTGYTATAMINGVLQTIPLSASNISLSGNLSVIDLSSFKGLVSSLDLMQVNYPTANGGIVGPTSVYGPGRLIITTGKN